MSAPDGELLGLADGVPSDGLPDGLPDGLALGDALGVPSDGLPDGLPLGDPDGVPLGDPDGLPDGDPEGLADGVPSDGLPDGFPMANRLGWPTGTRSVIQRGFRLEMHSVFLPTETRSGYRTGLPMGCLHLVIHWGCRKDSLMAYQTVSLMENHSGFRMAMLTECLLTGCHWATPTGLQMAFLLTGCHWDYRSGNLTVTLKANQMAIRLGCRKARLKGYQMDSPKDCRKVNHSAIRMESLRWGTQTGFRMASLKGCQTARCLVNQKDFR